MLQLGEVHQEPTNRTINPASDNNVNPIWTYENANNYQQKVEKQQLLIKNTNTINLSLKNDQTHTWTMLMAGECVTKW